MSLRGEEVQPCRQLVEARQGLRQGGVGQMILAEEVEQLGAQTDAGVELRIGARDISAELDQILGVAVGGEGGANLARGLILRGVAMALVRRLTEWRISRAG